MSKLEQVFDKLVELCPHVDNCGKKCLEVDRENCYAKVAQQIVDLDTQVPTFKPEPRKCEAAWCPHGRPYICPEDCIPVSSTQVPSELLLSNKLIGDEVLADILVKANFDPLLCAQNGAKEQRKLTLSVLQPLLNEREKLLKRVKELEAGLSAQIEIVITQYDRADKAEKRVAELEGQVSSQIAVMNNWTSNKYHSVHNSARADEHQKIGESLEKLIIEAGLSRDLLDAIAHLKSGKSV